MPKIDVEGVPSHIQYGFLKGVFSKFGTLFCKDFQIAPGVSKESCGNSLMCYLISLKFLKSFFAKSCLLYKDLLTFSLSERCGK